jgi:hypothetical protein
LTKDKTKWSYLAAAFDFEGCISIRSKPYTNVDYRTGKPCTWHRSVLQLDVANTNPVIMSWLIKNFGGRFYQTDLKNPKWQDRYNWRPTGHANKECLLLGILPYLVLKREQAMLALSYLRLEGKGTTEQYIALAERCQELNRKGKTVETNTSDSEMEKIESELTGDRESAPLVTVIA